MDNYDSGYEVLFKHNILNYLIEAEIRSGLGLGCLANLKVHYLPPNHLNIQSNLAFISSTCDVLCMCRQRIIYA